MIGMKKPHRHLFEQIEWSTERVLNQTMQRATKIGLEAKLLPTGYDVDDDVGLRRLCNVLLGQNAGASVAPNTRKFLMSIAAQNKL